MKRIFIKLLVIGVFLTSCENQPWDFPDFDYTTVYFAYQSPVRTLVLGVDYTYDNTLDNEHKCLIMATLGGVYENNRDVIIDVEVDNTLCDSLKFNAAGGDDAIAMPADYYSIPSDMQIIIPAGRLLGGIEVQLMDAFFDDTLSIKNTYVIPLVMNSVTNADSILRGVTELDYADRRINEHWSTVPKDYIMYAVKYINPWHASYLRRGIETIDGSIKNIYHEKYVENDQVCSAVTRSKNEVTIALAALEDDGSKTPFEVMLTFDDNNKCSVQNLPSASYTVTGSGKYEEETEMWGDKPRNALYLQFDVDFGTSVHSFADTLVLRDRGVSLETFNPVVVN
ncbi:MAG: DUF1735 domain-containing protein [Bacteroidales bacterium]|nr:DUF1735 domain-containing protein [Bacteroidales bacterium]